MSLQDVRTKATTVVLDQERHLLFDLNAFAELEDRFGSMSNAFTAMQSGSLKAARALLWAGLLHEDESLTERQVGSMVTLDNIGIVMDVIADALASAMPQDEDDTIEFDMEETPVDPH